jgi:hypothetical protein
MSNFQWDDSHISWFVNFFKDNESDITSRSFKREDIPMRGVRLVNKQDRRNLMEIVVGKGLAVRISGHPTGNKYAIRLFPKDVGNLPFSQEFLFDDRINDLPQSAWLNHWTTTTPVLNTWLTCKLEWLEIINLLKIYQAKGEITKSNLLQQWDRYKQTGLLARAKSTIALYALVRKAWMLFDLSHLGSYSSHDDLVLDMLFCDAELNFFSASMPGTQTASSMYKDLQHIEGFSDGGNFSGNYTEAEASRILNKKLKDITDEFQRSDGSYHYDKFLSSRLFASGYWLKELCKESDNDEIKRLLFEYSDAKGVVLKSILSAYNHERKCQN